MPHRLFPPTLVVLALCTVFGLAVASGSAAANPLQSSPVVSTLPTLQTSSLSYGGGLFGEGNWPGASWVPYSSTSPWNTQLPAYGAATLAANSSTVINYMAANWRANFSPWTVSNTPSKDTSSAWGTPLYWAASTDPTYTIHDTGYACAAPGSSACPTTVHIPAGAWRGLASSANLSVVQPDGHTEVDMWQVQNANPLTGGGTITVHAYGALDLNASGCCGGSTGADQGMAAGLIRGPDLASGVINHALAVTAKCTSGSYVAPAVVNASACATNPGAAPPAGARLQLKMSDSAIAALSVPAYQKTILRAMAHYGIYVTGSGGTPMDLDYEPAIQYTSFANTSNTVMSFLATQGLSDPARITIGLPWTDFQVVSTCYATASCSIPPSGDTTPPSTPTGLTASGQTSSSIALSWSPSTDNVGVTGYDVYLNGTKVSTTSNTTYTYAGLACGTSYTLAVDARDSAGNVSGQASLASSTTACPTNNIVYGSGPFGEGSWPGANWDPYSASSPWNTQLPAYTSAVLDPNNATEMGYVQSSWGAPFTPWPVSNTPSQDEASAWSHPLYWAKSTDPTYTIHDTGYACGAPASSACPTTMQIPNGAWHATGSDGWIGVIQPDGHTEIDAWQVQNANPISGGGTITVHDYGAVDLNGRGCCSGSTAANQGLQAGLIRGPELAGGVINHALTVSVPCTNGLYVPPATGAALGGCGSAPPDGARLQLKMSDAAIAALTIPAYQKTILTAMAHYGIYITDTGGNTAQTDLLYEPAIDYTAFGNTSNTVMSYLKTLGYSDPSTISINLPWSDFQVVNSCYAAGTC